MNKDYQTAKIFMGWLQDNSEAFPALELEDEGYGFKFQKTFPGLSFYVDQNDIMAWFEYQGEIWDGILVAELPEIAKEKDRFFCKECFQYSGKKQTYDSIESLIEDHSIRPFRDWVKKTLSGRKAVLFFKFSASTWVELWVRSEAEKKKNDMKFKEYGVAIEAL